MIPVYGRDEIVSSLVARMIPGMEQGFAEHRAIGFLSKAGRLVGGVVYHNWQPSFRTIEITGASSSPLWASKAVYQAMFDYPFNLCRCQMIIMQVDESNQHLARILRRWGFSETRIENLRGKGRAGLFFTFTDDQWARHPMNRRNRKRAIHVGT